jgi:hypothetical protein
LSYLRILCCVFIMSVIRLAYPMMPVSPFLIAPSVFSNVYISKSAMC